MRNLLFLSVLFLLIGTVACNQQTEAEKAAEEVKEAGEAISDAVLKDQSKLEKDFRAMQDKVDDKIAEIEANIGDASEDAKEGLQNQLDKLKKNRKKLAANMERMGDNIGDSWGNFKADAQKTMKNIEQDLKDTFDNN